MSRQQTPGVTSYVPPDAAARLTAAMNGRSWTGRHVADPVPFTGHPAGVPDAELESPLEDLADVSEAPEPDEPPSLADIVAGHDATLADHGARLAALETPLSEDEWTG